MTIADVLWTLALVGGACAVPVVIDECFPRLWPWLCRQLQQLRSRWLNRRARNRHPIIKDWK